MPETPTLSVEGKVELTIEGGTANPPGTAWHLNGVSINRQLRAFEGQHIRIDITILEENPPEQRQVRTIRDLTTPRP